MQYLHRSCAWPNRHSPTRLFAVAPRQRIIHAAPHERAAVLRARASITAITTATLAMLAAQTAERVRRREMRREYLDTLDDAEIEDQADQIVKDADVGHHFERLIVPVGLALGHVALDQLDRTLGRLSDFAALDPDAPKAARAAVKLANDRAAAMVGMRYDDAGALVPNPNPRWSITDSTRDALHDVIVNGIEQGQTADQIADAIATSAGFSPARAELIARTEVSAIDNAATLQAFRVARDNGVPVRKQWQVDGDPCDECAECDGEIVDLDDDFSCGSDPPLHPNCMCSVSGILGDND
jgi:SPP1 gp7 family putative phage head morphogenesis protein